MWNLYPLPSLIRLMKSLKICRTCRTNWSNKKCTLDIGEKARRKEIIRKTKM
jgi:hypothetical protein